LLLASIQAEGVMATMKAVCIESFGGPEALHVRDIEIPQPEADEVLIKVKAAGVNPVDYKVRSGRYPPVTGDQLPKVLGRDVSGTVAGCGLAVTDFENGDEVFALLDGGQGGYAEYVTVRAAWCAPKPIRLNHAQAAAVPLAAVTAWQGLFEHGHLNAGQRVLIHGGAGGVGHFAVQLAKLRGANVSTTVTAEDVELMRALGADQIVDHESERFEDVVHDVDVIFDLVAGDMQERSWAVLKDGGTMVSTVARPSKLKAQHHQARALSFVTHPDADELSVIGQLIDAGEIRPHVSAIFPLQQAAVAQDQLEHAHSRGKIVLEI
jgi:NADPH:quinone reductase-like Zn-dependent oxidoreductase